MNLPNQLTVARLGLTLVFVMVLSVDFPWHHTLAAVLFVVATITDYADGRIARERKLITDFGILMDPLVDKIMTAAGFIALIPRGVMPAWVAIVVIAREFLITGLRLLASSKGRILPSENLGKHKTSWQIATVLYFLILLSVREIAGQMSEPAAAQLQALLTQGGWVMITIAVAFTVVSGLRYARANWDLVRPG